MRRWIITGVSGVSVVVLLALGGIWGAGWWWQSRPEHRYAAALQHFRDGEQARHQEDRDAARRAYQAADAELQGLLGTASAPNRLQGTVLRARTLTQLALLATGDEAAGQVPPPGARSADLNQASRRCAAEAAADPACAEGQALMLDVCFREDQLDLAARYAQQLLAHQPEQPVTAEGMDLRPYIQGAHFVLGRVALRQVPPQPDEALEHVRAAEELQQRWANSPADARPRWRMIHLEAEALAAGAGRAAGEDFQARLTSGLQRLRDDLKPAAGGSPLFQVTGSDLRGLLDFLALAVEQSPHRGQTVERTDLLLTTWETLGAAPQASPAARREVAARFARWPRDMDKLPAASRLLPADWLGLYHRVEALIGRLVEVGAGPDPALCLALAKSAQQRGHLEPALRLARLGLQTAQARPAAASAPDPGERVVLELHATAAWLDLLQDHADATAEHLAALHEHPKHFPALVHLLAGMTALNGGQLERAVQQFQQARQYPEYSHSIYPHLGLAEACMGLGAHEQALVSLQKLDDYYGKQPKLPEEQRLLAEQLNLGPAALALELFRCHLALGHRDQALQYRESLRNQPEWLTATVLLLHHDLGRSAQPGADRKGPGLPAFSARREALAAARQELTEGRQAARDDPRLLLLEAELLEREGERTKAERLLREAVAAAQGKPDETVLVWACWLLRHGQTDEAGRTLDDLEKAAPAALRSRLPVLRAEWRLAQAPALKDAGRLLELVALPAPGNTADLYLVARDNPPSRYENNGVRHFWRGLTAHAAGDLATAARAYAGALSLAALRPEARPYFLAAVLQLDQQGAPATANDLLAGLLPEHPAEPVLLLGFTETALLLDNMEGMEKALASLEGVLQTQGQEPAAGASYRARLWFAAGRPDKAQAALEVALKSNPAHLPSLLLAGPVARANQDWPALLKAAAALEKANPAAPEALLWRAEALAGQEQTAQAEKVYRELLDKHPDQAEAYAGLIALREKSGAYDGALAVVARWRQRERPSDPGPVQAEVRVLARAGRAKEAAAAAEKASPAAEAEVSLAVARGFLEAGALDAALTWAQRALKAGLPGAETAAQKQAPDRVAVPARCLLGAVLEAQGRAARDPARRKALLKEAVEQYRAVYQAVPGHPQAGRSLALLLAQEEGEGEAAFAIAQRLRQGRYNQAQITGDRLPLELLDTLGTVYRISRHHREAMVLFRDAAQRYPREPVVLFRLGQAQAATGLKNEATANLTRAVQLAQERRKEAREPEEKARLQELLEQARRTLGQ